MRAVVVSAGGLRASESVEGARVATREEGEGVLVAACLEVVVVWAKACGCPPARNTRTVESARVGGVPRRRARELEKSIVHL